MYLLRALSGVSSPAGNRPQVRVQSPTVETFHWPFLDGLARFACRCTDFPPGACFLGNEPLPAFMYFRYVGIRVTNLERSLACIPDSSGCARSPVEPTLPSASRLVQALGFPSKDQVPGGACDR